jgi:outer membrane protein
MKSIRSSLMIIALLAAPAAAQPQTLTLERATEIAIQQQPSVRITKAAIEAAYGHVDQARVALRPTVSLSGTASVGSEPVRDISAVNPVAGGGFFTSTLSTGFKAQASWQIYDFGRTAANIHAAEANAQAVESSIGTTTLDIRSSVAIAFLEAVARIRLVTVADTTVRSEEMHLDQARKFVAAQAKDPIEVAQAQSRTANARSALAQAQSNAAVALAVLRSAIGWIDPATTFVVDQKWPTPPAVDPDSLPALVDVARKHRPELVQLDKQVVAAEASVTAARAERRPVLDAVAQTQWGPDTNDWSPQPNWAAGLTLSWQLFDGGKSKADVRVARAQVTGAIAQRDALLVSLNSELDAARSQIVANRANVIASNEAVAAARAALKLADARYTQGLGSQIELSDAQTGVTTAEGNLITAEWQLAEAWANLRRALGEH